MNKANLIDAVAQQADLSKAAAERAVSATVEAIQESLKAGDTVTLAGLGTFSVCARAERIGRNPKTGEPITVPASKAPKFKPAKGLKDAVNS